MSRPTYNELLDTLRNLHEAADLDATLYPGQKPVPDGDLEAVRDLIVRADADADATTPGKWHHVIIGGRARIIAENEHGQHTQVCTLSCPDGMTLEDLEANAALIAAAH